MINKVTSKIIKHCGKNIIIPNLRAAIRGYRFSTSRFGAPLKRSTEQAKRRKGS